MSRLFTRNSSSAKETETETWGRTYTLEFNACMYSCHVYTYVSLPLAKGTFSATFLTTPYKPNNSVFFWDEAASEWLTSHDSRRTIMATDAFGETRTTSDKFLVQCPGVYQIAGSYRGSYFPMTVLQIAEIAGWSGCRWCLVCEVNLICLSSYFPFWAGLGCYCRLVSPSFSPCMLSLLGRSWLPPFLPSLSPSSAALGCRCRLVSQACVPSWFLVWDFMISLLGCSCLLPVSPKLIPLHHFSSRCSWLRRRVSQACFPSWFLFWATFDCRCRLLPSPSWLLGNALRCLWPA